MAPAEITVTVEIDLDLLHQLNIPAREQGKNVFRVDTQFGAVVYYPSSGKWQHRGRTIQGDLRAFRDWLKLKHFL